MRPDNIRRSMTIYCHWTNPDNGLVKPFRRVLTNAFFSDQGTIITAKTGIVINNGSFAQIFEQHDLTFVPFHEWHKLSENELSDKWTIELGTTPSIIVNHVSEHEFDFDSLAEITRQENAFINSTPGAARIQGFDNNLRGTERARHIYLRY